MKCGEKYAELVQVQGYGPDNPTGYKPWASGEDVKLWHSVAEKIFKLVRQRWNVLMRAENERQAWPETDKLRPFVESYEAEYRNLPTSGWIGWPPAGASEDVQENALNAQRGTCIMEQLDEALDRAGVERPKIPWTTTGADVPWIGIVLGATGLAVAGVALTKPELLEQAVKKARSFIRG